MDYSVNYQTALAEQFVLMNTLTNQASYEVVLTIKRWKLMKRIQSMGKGYRCELFGHFQHTFNTFISPGTILQNEGFFLVNREN
jgi:hypothetical protein